MKKLTALFVMVLMVTGLYAQTNSDLPNVTIKDMEGKDVNVSKLSNDGNPFILTFWDLSCRNCIREHIILDEQYEDWQAETGVKIFSVNVDDSRASAKVRPFVDSKGWEFEFLMDPNKDLARALNVGSIMPCTFLFDGSGKLVYSLNGFNLGDEDTLYEEIMKVVKK